MSEELRRNLELVESHLARFREATLGHFIDGRSVVSSDARTYENLSPVDGSVIGKVVAGVEEDVSTACRSSNAAFAEWKSLSGKRRREILHDIADAIEARQTEIALVESMDTGQPLRFMSKAAVRGAENFRFFADRAPNAGDGRSLFQEEHLNYTTRSPIGPVGVITPWNTPFMLSTWKIAPALAAGCTVVHKPAEATPLSATLLAQICAEAGLPPGVLNTVNGFGEDAGRSLTEHPD
ncbi:MAG: aldehyde dehydrogenase family protein, partial [Pseudomonadota bacterium]